jgi:hypothetical protein
MAGSSLQGITNSVLQEYVDKLDLRRIQVEILAKPILAK